MWLRSGEVCIGSHNLSSTGITDGPRCGGTAFRLLVAVSMMGPFL